LKAVKEGAIGMVARGGGMISDERRFSMSNGKRRKAAERLEKGITERGRKSFIGDGGPVQSCVYL